MSLIRSMLSLLVVALLASLVAACGSDDASSSDSGDSGDSRDARPAETTPAEDVEPGSPEAAGEKNGGASFAITPALSRCMAKAGFVQDEQPTTGGLVSWTHPGGALVVIAPSSEDALALAGSVGTADAPANVEGARVSTGAPALTSAAAACIEA